VVVVGAGISGIGAAYHLQASAPDRSYVILEGRADIGGTWDLFRYPGVRSDSDMHTLGYSFKPWTAEKAIADGPSILAYLRETVAEFGIDRHIRFGTWSRIAEWSSDDALDRPPRHERTAQRHRHQPTVERREFTCNFLFMCSGYYSYRTGTRPSSPGGTLRRARRPPAAVARGPGLRGQAGGRHRLGRHRDDAHAGDGRRGRPRHHAAALAHLRGRRPDKDAIANTLRKVLPGAGCLRHHPQEEHRVCSSSSTGQTRTAPDKVKANLLKRVRKAWAGLRRGHATSRPATTRGISGCAWCPTATCSRRSSSARRGGHRPHRHASPKPA
jgi:monooxygenase